MAIFSHYFFPLLAEAPYHQEIRVVQVSSLKKVHAAGLVGDAGEVLQPLLRRQLFRGIWELQEGPHHNQGTDVRLKVRSLREAFRQTTLCHNLW